jgi:hypothetical protein
VSAQVREREQAKPEPDLRQDQPDLRNVVAAM